MAVLSLNFMQWPAHCQSNFISLLEQGVVGRGWDRSDVLEIDFMERKVLLN